MKTDEYILLKILAVCYCVGLGMYAIMLIVFLCVLGGR